MNKSFVMNWLPMGVAVTLLSVVMYGLIQQSVRIGANSLQTQMAEDAAVDIVERGVSPQQALPKVNVDMAASLAPYMIVYDDSGNILASSVVLDGKVPEIPKGVLDAAREKREHHVSWEPMQGVRSATVIVRYVGDAPGFVLVGRSLRDVEKLTGTLLVDAAIGWAVTMAGTLLAYALFRR